MPNKPLSIVAATQPWTALTGAVLVAAALLGVPSRALAHGVSEASQKTMAHGGIPEYIWLGAEHMVTGYDHLLFLFGVIFFLTGFRDVVRFITAFTLGHCITLLGATLAGVTANAYLIDAVIALSVIYKGFENLDGFEKTLKIRPPNLLVMVFVFGLIHGFGLSTRLQELPLGHDGLVGRILAFNVGVELGQVAALTVMLGFFKLWRSSQSFERFSSVANSLLVLAGVGLFFVQVDGYMHEDSHAHEHGEHRDHDDHEHGHGHDHDHNHDNADHNHDSTDHVHEHDSTDHVHDSTDHVHDSTDHSDEHEDEHRDEAEPETPEEPEASNSEKHEPQLSPDDASEEAPPKEKKGHSHGHSHSHSHGSGKPHSH